jgi:hypothetical protein
MSSRHADPTISDIDRLRARILDRIPLEERRRELAGISTAYLEAGDDPAFERPRDFLEVLRVALNTTTHEEATP